MTTIKNPCTGSYPTCDLCGNSLRRPCTIAYRDKDGAKGLVACASCYRVWMCLSFLARAGVISYEQ